MNSPCNGCGVEYPQELLQPMQTSSGDLSNICGICALAITNQVHGSKRKHFNGSMAEKIRLLAVRYRLQHKLTPTLDPIDQFCKAQRK